jgi:Flp pilus assembly pilin Flp
MAVTQRVKNLALSLRIWMDALRANTAGQDLVEYALMAGFVAVAAGAIMPGVAVNISRIFSSVGSVLFNSKNQGS